MFKSVFKSGIRAAYSVSDNVSFSTDSWAIYPAKHKQTGKLVSVFIFDKPKFEARVQRLCSQSANTRNPRLIISECYEQIKLEISQLTKLKHPQILNVLEVLEETKSKFLFVSEPVTASIATLDLAAENELGIQKGLLEISKSLEFLHNNSIIHMNIQPSSVFVTSDGDWKLGGFKFLQNLNEMSSSERENFYVMNSSSVVDFTNQNLSFTAPELIIDSASQRLSTANDLWSLGMLIYFLYNQGDMLINYLEPSNISDFKAEFRKFESKFYKHRPDELHYLLKNVPQSLWFLMTQLLARYPFDRITIEAFIDSDFFSGSLIKMMWFIDEFTSKATSEKIVFLDGLIEQKDLLQKLPGTFRNSKLLNLLIDSVHNEVTLMQSKSGDAESHTLITKALLAIFGIGESLSSLSFQDRIYDKLLNTAKPRKAESPLMKLAGTNVSVRLAIISNIDLLLKKLQEKHVVEIMKELSKICVTFDSKESASQSEQIKLQDSFLAQISLVAAAFDFPYVKNTLVPLICSVFKTTTVLSTKLQTIETFNMLVDKKVIDKVIVNEQILPVLENLKSRDKRIIAKVISFFERLSKSDHISLDLEVYVDKVISQCLRLAFGCNDCTKTEFEQFMSQINGIQQKGIKEKMHTLSDQPKPPPADNFSALINKAQINQHPVESNIDVPVLSPTSNNLKSESKRTASSLKLQNSSTRPLQFGATSAPSNKMNGAKSAGLQSTRNTTSAPNSTIDWSKASSSPTHSVLQPMQSTAPKRAMATSGAHNGNVSGNFSSGSFGIGSTSAASTSKLPPGFSVQMLSPTSTGSTRSSTPQQPPTDLLDLL